MLTENATNGYMTIVPVIVKRNESGLLKDVY